MAKYATVNGVMVEIVGSTEKYCLDLLNLPSITKAINTYVNDILQVPFYLYQNTDAGRVRAKGDKIDYWLSVKPNPFENAAEFWAEVAKEMVCGESFVVIQSDGLYRAPYGSGIRYKTDSGEVRYKIGNYDYSYGQVLHFYWSTSFSGIVLPLNVRFKALFNLGSDTYSYTCNIYNRGGMKWGYLSTDEKASDENKKDNISAFRKMFQWIRGDEKGKQIQIAALDNGWKFNSINLTPQELMILDQKKDWELDIAKLFSLPPWKMGIIDNYKYATAEAAQLDYLQSSLNPLLVRIEKELNCKLLNDIEREYFYVEANRDKLILLDAKTMSEVDHVAFVDGNIMTNEWRGRRNLSNLPGGNNTFTLTNTATSDFSQAKEQLTLESLRLDIAIKQKQLTQLDNPQPDPTPTEPAPTDNQPSATPSNDQTSPEPPQMASVLSALQTDLITALGAKVSPEGLELASEKAISVLSGHYSVDQSTLAKFRAAYLASAHRRLASADVPTSPAYEANRLVNAVNFELMQRQYGQSCQAKWVGGQNNGQTKPLSECWAENFKHPPITTNETNCFLVRVQNENK